MSQSLAKIYIHSIFSTFKMMPLIHDSIEPVLHSKIENLCTDLECYPVKVAGYYEHVHIVSELSKKIALTKFLEIVKKESSMWIKTLGSSYEKFYWQSGYVAVSVSPAELDKLVKFLNNQKTYHQRVSFKDELRTILNINNIEYDEKYIWD